MALSKSGDRPRILFLNHSAKIAGAEKVLEQLAVAHRENSQVVLLADGPFRDTLADQGVKVTVLAAPSKMMSVRTSSGLQALQSIPGVLQTAHQVKILSQDADLIHANSQKAFITACLARRLGGKPVIWHLHDILTASHFSPFTRKLAVFLSNIAVSALIAPSQAVIEAYQSLGGRVRNLKVIHNGMASDAFDRISPEDRQQVRQTLGLKPETPIIGLFSRISPWKGQHILLEAARKLPASVHILIVGSALFGEDEYAAKIQSQTAADPLLKDRVHWLGFRNDVPMLMSACDLIVHASTNPEPFGMVGIEGQLANKPVIATAAGGMFEIIEDGKTGCLVPPGDAAALAHAIQSLLDNPEMAIQMAERGRLNAMRQFSPNQFVQSYDQFIASIMKMAK